MIPQYLEALLFWFKFLHDRDLNKLQLNKLFRLITILPMFRNNCAVTVSIASIYTVKVELLRK